MAQAGAEMGCAFKTVQVHLQNVYDKLGIETRARLTQWAIRHGHLVLEGVTTTPQANRRRR